MTWRAILICCVVGAISLPFIIVIWVVAIDHISMILKKRKMMNEIDKTLDKLLNHFQNPTAEEQRKQFFDDLEQLKKQVEDDEHGD